MATSVTETNNTVTVSTSSSITVANVAQASTVLPVGGTEGQVLAKNSATNYDVEWVDSSSGSGDVVGPSSATDNAIARYNLTTGKLIQNSSVTVDDNGSVNIPTGQSYKINNVALAASDVGAATSDHNHSGVYEPANANIQSHISSTSNPHSVTAAQVGALTQAAADLVYAPIAKGVTNGDSHDHSGGDGAQIAYSTLSGNPTLGDSASKNVGTAAGTVAAGDHAHAAYEATANKGQANGYAGLDSNSKVATTNLPSMAYLLAVSNTDSSVTGTTNETTLYTYAMPAGTMTANGVLRITALCNMTNNANNKTIKIKLGATAFQASVHASSGSTHICRMIYNRNNQASQVSFVASQLSFGNTTGAVATGSIDTSLDQDITVTGQLANTGDTLTLSAIFIEVIK